MRRIALVVALLLAGLGPAAGPAPAAEPASQRSDRAAIPRHPSLLEFAPRRIEISAADPYLHRLRGGTPVVVVEDHTLPLVEVFIALPEEAGSESSAIGDLTAALMRRGGTEGHSPDDLDASIDFLGAEIDVVTGEGRAIAHLDAMAATFEESLGLLFDIVRRPAFDRERFEQLRANLLSSLGHRNDDPIDVMERELAWLLYGHDDPRARQLTASELTAIGTADLIAHHDRVWRPDAAVIAVSGAVDTSTVLRSLESYVEAWRLSVEGEAEPGASSRPPAESAAAPGLFWARHSSPQAKVSLARTLDPTEEWNAAQRAAWDVTNEILGGTGLLSRLGGRLRSREGLVYRVLSEVELRPERAGRFRIYLDTSAEALPRALEGVVEELERIRRQAVLASELETIRQELLTRLAQRFDAADEIAGYLAEDILFERPHSYWSDYLDQLQRLTPADVRHTAREALDPEALTVVVVGGPASLRALDDGPPRHRLVRQWLAEATELPPRDPASLEPLAARPQSRSGRTER